MKIWIINQHAMLPEHGNITRHHDFAIQLTKMGHKVTIFSGSFIHNTDIQMIKDNKIYQKYEKYDYDYYFIKINSYMESKKKRVYAMFEFYRNVIKTAKNLEKPDVIIGSSPHPLALAAAIKLGKKYKCKSIVEVRDFWPESFVAYKIVKKDNPILKVLYEGEKWIYKKADKVIFTAEGGYDYIKEKHWEKDIPKNKTYYLNNGVDIKKFDEKKLEYKLDDKDINNEDIFKVVYTGSLGIANSIITLVKAGIYIKNEKIKILIWGAGSEVPEIKKIIKENNLINVEYKGFIEKKYIPYILSKSNLNILHYPTYSILRFGCSQNKKFEYLASSRPILSTVKMAYDPVVDRNAGIALEKQSSEIIAEAIEKFFNIPQEKYNEYCLNARKIAEEYDFEVLTKKLIKIIED